MEPSPPFIYASHCHRGRVSLEGPMTSTEKIRVMIADGSSHRLCKGLSAIIRAERDMRVVGEAADGPATRSDVSRAPARRDVDRSFACP